MTMISVGFGALGVLLFLGYVQFIERTLSAVVIYRQGNGHVQVYKKDALTHLATEPEKFSIDAKAQQRIREVASGLQGVTLVTPQMEGVGIIQNNDRTAVFLASGVVPEDDRKIRLAGSAAVATSMDDFTSGEALEEGKPSLWLTKQLKQVLDLKPAAVGEAPYVQLAGIGFDRRLNASDADVVGEFSTSIEETENKSIKVPLKLLQDLYRTEDASRMVVVLTDRELTPAVSAQLQQKLDTELPGYEVTTWKHPAIGKLYESVMGFMGVVFAFTGVIVMLVCVLTVQNTINISVLERVRELGTLRAIGFGKGRLGGLFAREALILASLGAVGGIVSTVIVALALARTNLTTTLPRLSIPVPVSIQLGAAGFVAVLIAGGVMAALISYRSAKKRMEGQIVDAFQTRLLSFALFVTATLVGLGASPAHAESPPAAAPAAAQPAGPPSVDALREWIRASDLARGGYGAYTWSLTIDSEEPSGRTETSYRVDVKGDKALAYTLTPVSSKGEQILIQARSMWFMKPGLRKPVSISPRQRLSGQAANGDIASAQFADNYDPTLLGEDTVDGRAVHKVRLMAKRKDVTYDQVIFYLDKENHLALKAEYLTTSGTPFKYSLMKYGNKTPGPNPSPFISELKIVDSKYANQHSTLAYSNLKSATHPDNLFNLANLGR
ncbi:ABC efflux pump, inner membrane subunit, putative [Stigmatella aurantiaca DW4/3-1]|uniref:ABC efflux pump, inner membrane subunit, putative n=1 Tax=Stigmatella aurantiaca (strain DW4/3-1) TaxID=378806 RepID=Q08UT2_STIAD|nr:ABC efflux pump, inner membrane subunit, putative [Stigmatella aurantiaca DW4/3-1]